MIFILSLMGLMANAADFQPWVKKYSAEFKVDAKVVNAVIQVESHGKADAISPKKDSYGLMQTTLTTAKYLGFRGTASELMEPKTNIYYGVKYLAYLRDQYKITNQCIALDAYNRGIGNVRKNPFTKSWSEHKYVGRVIRTLGANLCEGENGKWEPAKTK